MHRFFVPPSWVRGNRVTITGPQAHQIANVLRMRLGDVIVVLDNSGWEIEVRLTSVDGNAVNAEVQRRRLSHREPRTKISLYQGVLRSSRFEYVLQKGTEVGVVGFVPVIADRCVMSDLEVVEKKRRRWEMIIQEAAEQCRRARKPVLGSAVLFPQVCEQVRHSGGLSLVLCEDEGTTPLREVLRADSSGDTDNHLPFAVNLLVGPEGGFTASEKDVAQRYGLAPVSLGPRILRSETAGTVAAAIILYELGDMQ